jgi:hypothetical protein
MTTAFVNQLRARPGAIVLGDSGEPRITFRVQLADFWDSVRITAPPTAPVLDIKRAALETLAPDEPYHEAFVVKLNGFEVLDEHASIADAGAVEGSTFLIAYRRRRPVR